MNSSGLVLLFSAESKCCLSGITSDMRETSSLLWLIAITITKQQLDAVNVHWVMLH